MMRDRSRRALQRRDWQQQRERDQQRKLEQAIMRAQKPRKWKLGRAVVRRMLPWNAKVMADLTMRLKGYEQKQEYRFLYENSDEEDR
jgi:ribosomal protein L13